MPAHRDRQHPKAGAQIARHEFHDGDIAAMAGDEHELADAGAREAFADLGPGGNRRRCRERQRTRKRDMLDRDADALQRQKGYRKFVGKAVANPRQIGFGDECVDAERKMRPMLFHRRKRQHRNPAGRVGACAGNVLPGHVHPVASR